MRRKLARWPEERLKSFLSRQTDVFRPPYGRTPIEAPRQCVFAATTNAEEYLLDDTGGRRFWPVAVHHIDLESLQEAVPQLWAEAVHLYNQGHSWWLDEDTAHEAREQQREREEALWRRNAAKVKEEKRK